MADASYFEKTALPHMDAVFRASLAMCEQRSLAEDLVQTTYLKALQRFDSFRPGTNCKAWLMRILHNMWIDRMRHRKVVGPTVPVDEGRIAEPDQSERTRWSDPTDLLENFSDEQVIRALAELSEEQRLTLYLVDVEQLSQEEVAEITSVAVGTVKSRASRGRAALRDKLEEHAKDMGIVGRRK